jgi:hypothetical protein
MKILFGARFFHPMDVFSFLIMSISTGIAYAIDPEYEAEVRDYLGEFISEAP